MIPGLENCQIVRYGVMHRNSFICSPKHLKQTYQFNRRDDLFFAGQITGVEGYVESSSSGIVAGYNMARYIKGEPLVIFDPRTVTGALAYYITHSDKDNFQPMKANFGILPDLEIKVKKKDKKDAYATRAVQTMKQQLGLSNE